MELASRYGLTMDDWQTDILRCWLGRTEDDKYASSTCGLIVPRQNGKNAIIEVRELFGSVILGEKILHTAHEVKTSMKAFARVKTFFGEKSNDPAAKYPELNALVSKISNVNGQEAIILKNGGSIEFSSRSRGASRGFTVDVTIYDEAQELTQEQQAASLPAKSAAPLGNPQTIYIGTPPNENMTAEVFSHVRNSAIDGATRMCWHEWSVTEVGDVHDKSRWYACNPAMPHRISETTVEDEVSNMPEKSFAMERLAWWPIIRADVCIDAISWSNCSIDEAPEGGTRSFGVKFSPDGSRVCVAGLRHFAKTDHVELIFDESMAHGTSWLAEWFAERKTKIACIVIDGRTGTVDLVNKLNAGGFPKTAIKLPSSTDVAGAASMFVNSVREHTVTHLGTTGQRGLTDSVLSVSKRRIGDGFGFDGQNCTPAEAASLALYAGRTTKRNPDRKGIVG